MATVSGGSKPTFTVDQVLHAVEMNQLNQEWIVDSVPAGSAGKNGDVVFVTSKGGVWAKVSGSWVQASLTSADIQTLQDQIDNIQSSGYDDTALRGLISDEETARIDGDAALQGQIDAIQSSGYDDTQVRADFAAADASTLESSKTYTDEEIAKIPATDVSDLATKTELSTGLAGKADEPHTHDTSHDHDSEYQPVGDYATNTELSDGLDTKSDTDHIHNAVPLHQHPHDHDGEYSIPTHTHTEVPGHNHGNYASTDHVHIQTGSGLTFDPSREGQVVQSTNGTDWIAGMSLRVVTSVPDDTEGEIGDVVFVVGS